ncbi:MULTISPECIES: Cmx/CmrA family chloramphenicol efflux MFS transporter [unclassified Streptomyces]|uniref:Cmx/CmrA family chloramphenicol efflux MFS transporter n=1 Tax=unclassified Streptomyces TaxID=2593676 RepID=UPI0015872739|nr:MULTISPECIES: Cmx/CmrA family chloramphenicol efflux MFS transporter [unclassified Streptomyces]NUV68916.1 MFS transporter [Streptomyces sp. CAI-121]NUW01478.1 MFS transporter [Streptomyces sp. CAI 127]NUW15221.1 MFS transporter [Streptomyces sp. CAI-68]
MPFAVYVLGLAVFAQGTSEFMLSGLLSGIAADLGVSLSAAGLLTSAFAVGMVVGAPLMALFSRAWPRRRALLLFLAVFVAVHVVGALTPGYGVLLATRFVGALANAGFWAVALSTAVAMVPDRLKGRAAAVVVGGVTIACVVGVPAGAVLGESWGWRSAFWAVAIVSLPAFVAVLRTVPGGRGGTDVGADPVPVRDELRVLTGPRLRPVLLTMALVQGATFCAFSYLEPLLTRETGLGAGWVPVSLALFGAGAFAGVTVAGRFADAHPVAVVATGMAALTAGWSALATAAGSPVLTLALIPLLGLLAFGTGTALITRVLGLAPGAPTLAGAFSTTAFNLGATVGPWAGGLALDAGFGYRAPVGVSAALMVLALLVAATTAKSRRPRAGERRLSAVNRCARGRRGSPGERPGTRL